MAGFTRRQQGFQGEDLRRRDTLMVHAKYKDEKDREQTFENWSKISRLPPYKLYKNGFFYLRQDDLVCCFHCGVCLRNWAEHDDPLKEHSTANPNCGFLVDKFGEPEIKRVSRTAAAISGSKEASEGMFPALEASRGYNLNWNEDFDSYNVISVSRAAGNKSLDRDEIDGKTDDHKSLKQKIDELEAINLQLKNELVESRERNLLLEQPRDSRNIPRVPTDDHKSLKQKIDELEAINLQLKNELVESRERNLLLEQPRDSRNIPRVPVTKSAFTQTDRPPNVAFETLRELGYTSEEIENAVEMYFRKNGHRDYTAVEIYNILDNSTEDEMKNVAGGRVLEDEEVTKSAFTQTDRPPNVAFQTLREFGYTPESIENAVEMYFRKIGHRDYNAVDICNILDNDTEDEMKNVAGGRVLEDEEASQAEFEERNKTKEDLLEGDEANQAGKELLEDAIENHDREEEK